jgi:hypothetical protein
MYNTPFFYQRYSGVKNLVAFFAAEGGTQGSRA